MSLEQTSAVDQLLYVEERPSMAVEQPLHGKALMITLYTSFIYIEQH